MRVILSVTNYKNLTGSELYVYELAKQLHKRGALVMILANQIGGELYSHTPKDILVRPFFDHPEFPADLVISSQPQPTVYAIKNFPDSFHIQVTHSLLRYEQPVIDSRVNAYVAVRPEIKEHWVELYPQLAKNMHIIWNGVDTGRFNANNKEMRHRNRQFARLFVGTADYLRKNVITDLMDMAIKDNTLLWLLLDHNPFKQQLPDNITIYQPTWKVETYVKQCDETAGIFIGRTTIEGWMCGKPGLVYTVDSKGIIIDKVTMGVPENKHMFDSAFMVDRISEVYMKNK